MGEAPEVSLRHVLHLQTGALLNDHARLVLDKRDELLRILAPLDTPSAMQPLQYVVASWCMHIVQTAGRSELDTVHAFAGALLAVLEDPEHLAVPVRSH